VKNVFVDFVLGSDRTAGRGRPDDLVGMVVFAGFADSICPLTLDHGSLVNIVKDLEIVTRREEDGTALGDGLGLAVERLRRSKAKSRIAILLTDGVANAGVITPEKAAELAAENDIKVYCIGVGTQGVAPVPTVDFFGRLRLIPQPVRIDEKTLRDIAEKTAGQYFRAVDKDALSRIYREIDALERTEVTEVKYLQYSEHFPYFVTSGLCLIATALVLNSSLFRRLP
jgi:Ca-activated chloride channel family protein